MSPGPSPEPASDPASANSSARVAELFDRHGRMAYGICRAMLRDAHEAEDATQQAFLSAHRALIGGARVRDTGAWLATIARNECRARIAARMRLPLPVADEDLDGVPSRVDDVEQRLQAGELRDALAELPERQREAVLLRYVYGLRYGEVARALGLSRPATEALLFRARRSLRVRLRHVAGAALVVPLSVREELALALPGFESKAGSGVAAAGVASGLLAKLAFAPAAAKIATASVAVSTVGVVGVAAPDRPASTVPGHVRAAEALSAGFGAGTVRARPGASEQRGGDSHDERGEGEGSGSRAGSGDANDDNPPAEESGAGSAEDEPSRSASGRDERGSGSSGDERSPSNEPGRSGSSGPGSGDEEAERDESSGAATSGSGASGSGTPGSSSGSDEPEEERPGESSGSSGSTGSSGSEEDGSSSGSGSDGEADEGH